MVSNPNLLFLDEPTTGLDSSNAIDIIKNLSYLAAKGITVITTIHSPSDEILEYFDNILILSEGSLVYDDKPRNIYKRILHL